MPENRNYILAIALSVVVLIAWHFFYNIPNMQKRDAEIARQQAQQVQQQPSTPGAPSAAPATPGTPSAASSNVPTPGGSATPGASTPSTATRETAIASSQRVPIETPTLSGSLSLKGARIDDLLLNGYRETIDPKSPRIELLSPSGAPHPYYAEFGWIAGAGAGDGMPLPNAQTEWSVAGNGRLTPENPVTLTWDNGQGLVFNRKISVDSSYMFTVTDEVRNNGDAAVTLYPYGLVSRHGRPQVAGYYILHEGMIGVLGEAGLQEVKYKTLEKDGAVSMDATGGWLGITDKYWAAVLIPDQSTPYKGRFVPGGTAETPNYQADYLMPAVNVPASGTASTTARLFAGAKEVSLINSYEDRLGISRFDLMIDWGWFYFLTKPLFVVIDWLYKLVGNFGVAILLVTVMVKLIFFPLANKSYTSMSKMKKAQPMVEQIKQRYPDDRMKQQQAMMELYKKEKINPMSGCLPILLQIPVFFSLYKVLFVTIEMRHAPFFGWIQDLSAPDPTSVFTLFGLIPWEVPHFLMIGIWPLIMGVTMFVQMRLNPPPPDPTQAMIFNWMPVVFTFMLGTFPAGLVIYWAWNNTLSIIQQSIIMRRLGVKVELWGNIRRLFPGGRKKTAE
ncbi:MAG: membrane protein insertase YidC [Flavobacteriaceae bacterium]